VTVVFDDSARLEAFLEKLHEMNLGLSITVIRKYGEKITSITDLIHARIF